jgi:hypothetical protein
MHNQELYALFKVVEIRNYMKLTRLRWAGRVMRNEDQETSKKILLLAQPLDS